MSSEYEYMKENEERYSTMERPCREVPGTVRYSTMERPCREVPGTVRYSTMERPCREVPGTVRYSTMERPCREVPGTVRYSTMERPCREVPGTVRYSTMERPCREVPGTVKLHILLHALLISYLVSKYHDAVVRLASQRPSNALQRETAQCEAAGRSQCCMVTSPGDMSGRQGVDRCQQ